MANKKIIGFKQSEVNVLKYLYTKSGTKRFGSFTDMKKSTKLTSATLWRLLKEFINIKIITRDDNKKYELTTFGIRCWLNLLQTNVDYMEAEANRVLIN